METKNDGLTAEMVAEQMIKDTFSITKKGEVLTTTNYNLFRFLTSNRDISQKNFNKLVNSLRQKNVYGASTILVKKHEDGFYYIYEGQHRFEALKFLKQPIDFIVNQELEIDDVSLMNTASEIWFLKDFLKKYLNDEYSVKNYGYHRFKRLLDTYGTESDDDSVRGLTFTDILFISTGWGNNVTKQFKEGNLTITDTQYERATQLCNTLQPFMNEDVLPSNINNRKYVRALIFMFEKIAGWTQTDTKILLKHIKTNKVLLNYKNYTNEMMYINLLAEVYNREQKKRFIGMTIVGKDVEYFMRDKK